MAFLALKKRETFFNIRLRAQEVIRGRSLNRNEPGHAIETNFSSLVIDKIVNFSRYFLFSPSRL